MFEEIYKKRVKEYSDSTKKLILNLQKDFDDLWTSLVQELEKRKLTLEDDIKGLEKDKGEKTKKITEFSDKLIKITETIEKENKNVEDLEAKKDKVVEILIEKQKRVEAITERENKVKEDEQKVKDEKMEVKAQHISLDEKQRRIKSIYDKLNE